MLKLALRDLRAHIGRYLLTFIAVAIGVTFISGVTTLTDTMTQTFDDLFADIYAGTDAQVRGEAQFETGFEGGNQVQRPRIDASLLDTVEQVDGVEAAAGSVQGFTQLIDKDGDPYGNPNFGAPTFGASWTDVQELNAFHLVEGKAPTGSDEIVIDKATANGTDYAVGDKAKFQTQAGVGEATIVGIAKFGTADGPLGASFVMFELPTAEELLAEPGKVNDISVVADNGVSQTEIRNRLADALKDDEVEVITGEALTEETQDDTAAQFAPIRTFLLVFALISVVVGGFVIYTSFSFIVAQQQRQMALLRAVGASRRQVLTSVLLESVAVGVVASLLGYGLGVGLASALSGLMIENAVLTVKPTSFVAAILVGIVVTMLSALLPAWRAARVPPVAAMRDVSIDVSATSRLRLVTGLLVLAAGVAALVGGAAGGELLVLGAGMLLVFLAFVWLGPIAAKPGATVLGAPLAATRGIVGRLARLNASRNPKRTALTASALMIGLGVATLFLVMNASLRSSIDKLVDESFKGDYVVNTASQQAGVGLPSSVAQDINGLPDVDTAAGIRYGFAEVEGSATNVSGLDPSTAFDLFDVGVKAGNVDGLDQGGIAVTKDKADDEGWKVGDELTVKFAETGDQTLPIAALIDDQPFTGTYAISTQTFEQNVPNSGDNLILVKLKSGITPSEAKPSLEQIVDQFPTAKLENLAEFKESTKSGLNIILAIMGVLLLFTIVIAMVGIVNTLILSVVERTREIGLTRAVGAHRSQIRSTIRWEALVIAAFGLMAALSIGIFFGWVLVSNMGGEGGIDSFQVPIVQLILVTVVTLVLTLLASLIPAAWAGRRPILAAIASE